MKIVLQKFIADSGYCSRRQAEELLRQGRVTVNGQRAELGMRADAGDDVRADGRKIVTIEDKIYILLNKPAGYTCTTRKFTGEKNVFELLDASSFFNDVDDKNIPLASMGGGHDTPARHTGKVMTFLPPLKGGLTLKIAGRLDKNSRGLVLLTNDGDLVQKLTHPRYGHEKCYIVKVRSKKYEVRNLVDKFLQGIDIGEGDGVVRALSAKYLGGNKFEIVLTEGKKRQIRRMFKAIGYQAEDLVRIRIKNLKLGNLPEGKWRHLRKEEIGKLK